MSAFSVAATSPTEASFIQPVFNWVIGVKEIPGVKWTTESREIPVASWVTGGKKVSVFQENNKMTYLITKDFYKEKGNISLHLYRPGYEQLALDCIRIFHRVLLGNNSHEHCFLPIFWKFCEMSSPKQELLIALFAQMRLIGSGGKEVVKAKWAAYEKETGRVRWLEVEDKYTREFLVGAPSYRDKMDVYCQHFKEIVTLGADNRVQAIVMRCVSTLDRDVFLDEDTCAITLISVQKRHRFSWIYNVGHGSIAWEGIEAGSYFLRSADLTTVYPDAKSGQARIRIVDRKIPSKNWLVGPTCSRTKQLTNKMKEHISRDLVVKDDIIWSSMVSFNLFAPIKNLLDSLLYNKNWEKEKQRRNLTSVENCLSFAISALQCADIFLPEPGFASSYIEPNGYVKDLQSNYIAASEDSRIIYKHKRTAAFFDNTHIRIKAHICLNGSHGLKKLLHITLDQSSLRRPTSKKKLLSLIASTSEIPPEEARMLIDQTPKEAWPLIIHSLEDPNKLLALECTPEEMHEFEALNKMMLPLIKDPVTAPPRNLIIFFLGLEDLQVMWNIAPKLPLEELMKLNSLMLTLEEAERLKDLESEEILDLWNIALRLGPTQLRFKKILALWEDIFLEDAKLTTEEFKLTTEEVRILWDLASRLTAEEVQTLKNLTPKEVRMMLVLASKLTTEEIAMISVLTEQVPEEAPILWYLASKLTLEEAWKLWAIAQKLPPDIALKMIIAVLGQEPEQARAMLAMLVEEVRTM